MVPEARGLGRRQLAAVEPQLGRIAEDAPLAGTFNPVLPTVREGVPASSAQDAQGGEPHRSRGRRELVDPGEEGTWATPLRLRQEEGLPARGPGLVRQRAAPAELDAQDVLPPVVRLLGVGPEPGDGALEARAAEDAGLQVACEPLREEAEEGQEPVPQAEQPWVGPLCRRGGGAQGEGIRQHRAEQRRVGEPHDARAEQARAPPGNGVAPVAQGFIEIHQRLEGGL